MLSGTSTTPEVIKHYQDYFENSVFIPLYGYFAFGDAIGVHRGKNIQYYPNYPFTVILPLVPENGRYRIAKYGERGLTGIIIARPEILIVKPAYIFAEVLLVMTLDLLAFVFVFRAYLKTRRKSALVFSFAWLSDFLTILFAGFNMYVLNSFFYCAVRSSDYLWNIGIFR